MDVGCTTQWYWIEIEVEITRSKPLILMIKTDPDPMNSDFPIERMSTLFEILTATSRVGSSRSVMGSKRESCRAEIIAYSGRDVRRGSEEKVPMQPRREGDC
ncbi:hypothetical protein BHYA_0265g00090 [Botrytis hyacinthi]|uniref:Uncharacterized protein n=1 Tax=Botrytis hyacinthi TaxID=278943 RepID=A0A4Z1GCC5_9HELO|nr:hypothetical protein BHYA_0265g00090 [Botrytis hyacinthi]